MWTPWGFGEVSCIKRGPHFGVSLYYIRKQNCDTVTQQSVLNIYKGDSFRGVL